MANVPKSRRVELVGKAADAAGVALQRLTDLSNSGNPDVAARATAILVLERNEQDDLNVIQQILGNKPANGLKPISDDQLILLQTLESSIDARIKNNQLINATISGASEILRSSEAIGQILEETP
jgi:hypothetical protein